MLPAPLWLALVRAMLVVDDGTRITQLSLHGESCMEDKWERLSQVRRLREHPIHRCAVPLPQWGRQRGGGFAAKKEANPASLRSAAPSKGRGSRGHSLLPTEGGAPKGRRLDGEAV